MAYPMTSSTTLSRREMNKRDKRQRLLTESLRLFREKGFEQTKVSDITTSSRRRQGHLLQLLSYERACPAGPG